jgi:hypothetical protein
MLFKEPETKITIEIADISLTLYRVGGSIDNIIDKLIIPGLLAAGFSEQTVREYIPEQDGFLTVEEHSEIVDPLYETIHKLSERAEFCKNRTSGLKHASWEHIDHWIKTTEPPHDNFQEPSGEYEQSNPPL